MVLWFGRGRASDASWFQGMVPRLVLSEGGTRRKWGLLRDPVVTETKALKEVVGTWSCLFLSLPPGHEVGGLAPPCVPTLALHLRPKPQGSPEPPKLIHRHLFSCCDHMTSALLIKLPKTSTGTGFGFPCVTGLTRAG